MSLKKDKDAQEVEDGAALVPLKELLNKGTALLKAAEIASPREEAVALLSAVLKRPRADLILSQETLLVGEEDQVKLNNFFQRRAQREPLSRLLGTRSFWKGDFLLSEETLDPRPDSEILVEAVLALKSKVPCQQKKKEVSILELGVGTGALLLSVISDWPEAKGLGLDLSEGACTIAKKNAFFFGLQEKVTFIQSNWFENVEGKFDIVFSNPPYICSDVIKDLDPEVKIYDPLLALDGGTDGLDCYRKICCFCPAYLNLGGFLLFEVGQDQAFEVQKLMEKHGFTVENKMKDYAGIERVLIGQLSVV